MVNRMSRGGTDFDLPILVLAIDGTIALTSQAIQAFIAHTGADELMLTSGIFDHTARLRSYEIVANIAAETTAFAESV